MEKNPRGTGEELAESVIPILPGMPQTDCVLPEKWGAVVALPADSGFGAVLQVVF